MKLALDCPTFAFALLTALVVSALLIRVAWPRLFRNESWLRQGRTAPTQTRTRR